MNFFVLIQISLEEYLATPTGENLVALGNERAKLIVDSLARGSPDDPPSVEDVAALYTKVTSSYVDQSNNTVKQAVETTSGKEATHFFFQNGES